MGNRTPRKPAHGKPAHSESGHGPETHKRIIEQLESGPTETSREQQFEEDRARGAVRGRRRLVEDREQHDEAEKNSESQQVLEESRLGGLDGPSDNSGNLSGHLGAHEHRADNTTRDAHGREEKPRVRRDKR